ncbi:MAG: DUF3822 family protein [Bacteroidia bacterium]
MSEQITYHNALSDRLVVCHFTSHTQFVVYSKELIIKYQSVTTDGELPPLLVNAIFSETHLVRVADKFTLAPLGEVDYSPYFNLNHREGHNLATEDTELFTVVYNDTPLAVQGQLVGEKLTTDISLTYHYGLSKAHKNALYFYVVDDILTILAWQKGEFILANRYAVANDEELFYYVMLVINQLELSASDLHFELIGSSSQYEQYTGLFKKYVSPLQSRQSAKTSSDDASNVLAQFFGTCVL